MARATRKARGGQSKPSAQRKSRSVTIRVLEGFKQRIEAEAAKSGRSVSEEIAYRVGLSYLVREPVETAAEVARILGEQTDRTIEAALERARWDKRNDPRYGGRVWTPPNQAPLQKSNFVAAEEIQEAAHPVQESARPVVTMTPAFEEALTRIVETAFAKALSKAKLTIPGEEK
jgi:hypothetical protein